MEELQVVSGRTVTFSSRPQSAAQIRRTYTPQKKKSRASTGDVQRRTPLLMNRSASSKFATETVSKVPSTNGTERPSSAQTREQWQRKSAQHDLERPKGRRRGSAKKRISYFAPTSSDGVEFVSNEDDAGLGEWTAHKKENKQLLENTKLGVPFENNSNKIVSSSSGGEINGSNKEGVSISRELFNAFEFEDPSYSGIVPEDVFRQVLLENNVIVTSPRSAPATHSREVAHVVGSIVCKYSDGSGFVRYLKWLLDVTNEIGDQLVQSGTAATLTTTGKAKQRVSENTKQSAARLFAHLNGICSRSQHQLNRTFNQFDANGDRELTIPETKKFLLNVFPNTSSDVIDFAIELLPFTNTYPVGVSDVFRNKLTLSFRRFVAHIKKYHYDERTHSSSDDHVLAQSKTNTPLPNTTLRKPPSSHKNRRESFHDNVNITGEDISGRAFNGMQSNIMAVDNDNNDIVADVYDPNEDVVVRQKKNLEGNIQMEQWIVHNDGEEGEEEERCDGDIIDEQDHTDALEADNYNYKEDNNNDFDVSAKVQHVLELQSQQQQRISTLQRSAKVNSLDTTVKKGVGTLRNEEKGDFFSNKPGAMLHLAMDLPVPNRARDIVESIKTIASTRRAAYLTLCRKHDPFKTRNITKKDFQEVFKELGVVFSPVALQRALLIASCENDVDVPYIEFIDKYKELAEKDGEEAQGVQKKRMLSAANKTRPNNPVVGRRSKTLVNDRNSSTKTNSTVSKSRFFSDKRRSKRKENSWKGSQPKSRTQDMNAKTRVHVTDVNNIVESKIPTMWWKLLKQCRRFDHRRDGFVSTEIFRMLLRKFDVLLDDDQYNRLAVYWGVKGEGKSEKAIPYKKFIDHFACKTTCNQTQDQMLTSGTLTKMKTKRSSSLRELYGRISPMIENNFTSIRRALREQRRSHETVTMTRFFSILQRYGVDLSEDEENEVADKFEKEGGIAYNDFFRDCLK
eukprot:m.205911 g.205911  ORF g.205911 m.205911 type:complete len:964 (+) comp13753_c1_seq1:87-2978(+)